VAKAVGAGEAFRNRYHLVGVLEAVTAIHVGSGEAAGALDPRRADNAVVRYGPNGLPYLPGSSLKGVSRAWLARVLGTKGPAWACGGICARDRDRDTACAVCRLFGTTAFAGRVYFADAPATTWDRHAAMEVRSFVALDLDTGSKAERRLYDAEVVPAGHRFAVEWYADDVDAEEQQHLRLLRLAWEEGMIAVGGGTSRGLGRVRLVGVRESLEDLAAVARRIVPAAAVPRERLAALLADLPGDQVTFDELCRVYDAAAGGTP
jgi:CRISPR/Cas system CSM-associated protein Csm3 (group 7 of RAMP superfamily)